MEALLVSLLDAFGLVCVCVRVIVTRHVSVAALTLAFQVKARGEGGASTIPPKP